MHIPDVLLGGRAAVATAAIGTAGLGYALRRVDQRHGPRTTSLMGMTAAFVFAAQMVNFPVGPGVTGHLLGGVLSAVLLGPWAGAVVMAAVLIVQCLLFQDGGVTALGANFVNMGLVGAVGGHAIYAPIRRALGGRRGVLIGSMVAAWFSVLLAAGAFAIELGAGSGREDFFRILSWMALVHAGIGVGEAIITGLVVRFVLLTRPELIEPDAVEPDGTTSRWPATVMAGLGVALAIAVFASPFAADAPDGLEYVGEKLGFLPGGEPRPVLASPMPEYQAPVPVEFGAVDPIKAATAAAGLIGTLVVFGFAWTMARVFARRDAERGGAWADAA